MKIKLRVIPATCSKGFLYPIIVILLLAIFYKPINAQTPTPPIYGDGSSGNPYQIATLENLVWITTNSSYWNNHFIQIADIDASASSGWYSGFGMPLIGSGPHFTGTYDGNGHVISGIYINKHIDGQIFPTMGLFQTIGTGGIVKNLGLTNVNIYGYQFTGALAGFNYGTVANCFSTGTVRGDYHWVGGLIGENQSGGSVQSSYSTATIISLGSGQMYAGFMGSNRGSISDSYATGTSSGTSYVSSFTGRNLGGSITRCYGNGLVVGTGSNLAGLVAYNSGIVTDSYWDTQTTGQLTSAAGTPKTTTEMLTQSTYTAWDFSTVWSISSDSNNGYPYLLSNPPLLPTLTWDGSTGNDWANAANWSPEIVPSILYNVIIPDVPNEPVINNAVGASCNNLTLNNSATLTVASGGSLITEGLVTGNITIQRTVTGSTDLEADTYHLVSVPLHPDNNSLSELFLGSYLYGYDPAENEWSPLGTSTSVSLDETLGYMIFYPDASTTYTFTGQPNTGTFTPTVTYAGNSGGNNFALVPNPYPSNIDWNAASGWTKTNIGNTIWVYNNGNYATWNGTSGTNNGSRYIAAGQAFFVQTTASLPSLVMNNGVRTHTSATFLKNTLNAENQLRIRALANGMQDEILAGFADGASFGYDPMEDALKLFGAGNAPQLYTLAGDNKVSINQLAELNGSAEIPVHFETEFNGEITLEFSQIESFQADLKVRLEDKLTGQWANLRETSSYLFNHNPTNPADRFVLHFGSTTGISEPAQDNVKVWAAENSLYLSTPELAGEKARIELFNAAGQMILEKNLTLNALQQFNLTAKGVVLVRITLSDRLLTAKTIVF